MLKFVIACICAGDCVFAKLTFVGVQICLYSCEWVYVCVDVCVFVCLWVRVRVSYCVSVVDLCFCLNLLSCEFLGLCIWCFGAW